MIVAQQKASKICFKLCPESNKNIKKNEKYIIFILVEAGFDQFQRCSFTINQNIRTSQVSFSKTGSFIPFSYTKKDLIEVVPQARSVPQIFLDGEYVGGLQELKRKLANDNNKNTSMV